MPSLLGQSGATGLSNAFTIVSGSNRRGVAVLSTEYNSAGTVTASMGGVSLTLVATAVSAAGGGTEQAVYVFDITEADFATMGNGSKTLTFSVVGGSYQGHHSLFSHWSDAGADALSVATAGSTVSSTSATVNVSPAAGSAAVVGLCAHNNAATSSTAGSGYTLFYDAGDGGGDSRGVAQFNASASAGSQACDIAIPLTRWAIAGVVFEHNAGGGGTDKLPPNLVNLAAVSRAAHF